MTEWYTEEGNTGELELESHDGCWYISNRFPEQKIQCIIQDDELIDGSDGKLQVEVTVSSFRRGTGGDTSYLFVKSSDKGSKSVQQSTGTQRSNLDNTTDSTTSSSNQTWTLAEFSGSGEYVDVQATVDSVFFVKKEVRGMPDLKGELTDDSVLNPVTFIVEEGTSHPYLEEGKKLLLRNVKDHFYKKEAEVQVVISKTTDFVER